MGILNREVELVQNPALGAGLLLNCTKGYVQANATNSPMPIPLLYLVLPIVLHEETEKIIASTQTKSGLRMAASKFIDSSIAKNDLLLAIHDRALTMRELTTRSVSIGIACKLFTIDIKSANVIPYGIDVPDSKIQGPVSSLFKSSSKLGYWFGTLTLQEVAVTLKFIL
jgi:hypothetical protein